MKQTATHQINGIARTFELTESPVGPNLKADLIKRGFDGTAWLGLAPAQGRMKQRTGLFYRSPSGHYQFICAA